MILGLILGPMAEQNLNRGLIVSGNSWMFIFASPISATFIFLSALALGLPLLAKAWMNMKPSFKKTA
jgi:putative tricarboxylic transport membrane protein